MTRPAIYQNILRQTEQGFPRQVKWRRHLHQSPELSQQEFSTTKFLTEKIKQLGLKQLSLKMQTGLLASLRSGKTGKCVAIRTDIDALPITEQTRLTYRSRNNGVMHACGHDLHMATVLGAAAILQKLSGSFAGEVRFLFQPAEEQPPGGARPMIAAGALKHVDMILGLHVDSTLPTGQISLRDGVTMASVYDFDIIVRGRASHAARPHNGVDAISTAAELIESLQKVVAREIDPVSPAVLTCGKIQGGTARNIIADQVVINATARALSETIAKRLPLLIKKTVAGICRARGADYEIVATGNYPVLKNDPRVNRLLAENYFRLWDGKVPKVTEQTLGGEDFACYLEQVPGAMFRLGVRNSRLGSDRPWHAVDFKVDDAAMKIGSALLAATAIDFLNNH